MRTIHHALIGLLVLQGIHSCWGQGESRKLKSSKSRKGPILRSYEDENVFGMKRSKSKSSKSGGSSYYAKAPRSTKSGGFLGVGFPISKGKGKGFVPPAFSVLPTRAPVSRSLPNTPAPQQAQDPSTPIPTSSPVAGQTQAPAVSTNTSQTISPTLTPGENQPTSSTQQSDGGSPPNNAPTTDQQQQGGPTWPSSPSYLSPTSPIFLRSMQLSVFYLLEDGATPSSADLKAAGETTTTYLQNYMRRTTYHFDVLESSVYESTKEFPITISWEVTFFFSSEPVGVQVNNVAKAAFMVPEAGKLVKELIKLPASNPFSRVKYVGLPEDAVAWASPQNDSTSSSSKKKSSPSVIAIVAIISLLALFLGIILFVRRRRKLVEIRGRALLDESLSERSPEEDANTQLKPSISSPTQSQMTLSWSYASSKVPNNEEVNLLSPTPSNETEDSDDLFIDDENDRSSIDASTESDAVSSISHRSDSTKSSRRSQGSYLNTWEQQLTIDDSSSGANDVIYFEEDSQDSASYGRGGLL